MRKNRLFRLIFIIGAFYLVYIYFSVNDNSVETENDMTERRRKPKRTEAIFREPDVVPIRVHKQEEDLPHLKAELENELEVFCEKKINPLNQIIIYRVKTFQDYKNQQVLS